MFLVSVKANQIKNSRKQKIKVQEKILRKSSVMLRKLRLRQKNGFLVKKRVCSK